MWSNARTMALTQKDLDLIVKALEPRFELLEGNLTQRIDQLEIRLDQLERDVIKAIVGDLMPQVEDHERRISKLENARVVS